MTESNLILGIAGLPPESARNCIQELSPIANGEFRKSINGNLMFLETTERKKYKSTISCSDTASPIADKLWIGSQITVGCIQNLWQSIMPGERQAILIRPAVAGSICVINNFGKHVPFQCTDNVVDLYRTYEEQLFICFRPWLTMLVKSFQIMSNEWDLTGGWKLELEEV